MDPRPLFSVHRARLFVRGKAEKRLTYLLHLPLTASAQTNMQCFSKPKYPTSSRRSGCFQYNYGKGKLKLSGFFDHRSVAEQYADSMVPNHEPALTSTLARRLSVGAGHRKRRALTGGRISVGGTVCFSTILEPSPQSRRTRATRKNLRAAKAKNLPVAGNLMYATGNHKQFRAGDLLVTPNPWDEGFGLLIGASGLSEVRPTSTKVPNYKPILPTFTLAVSTWMGNLSWVYERSLLRPMMRPASILHGTFAAAIILNSHQSLLSPSSCTANSQQTTLVNLFARWICGITNVCRHDQHPQCRSELAPAAHRVRLGVHGLHVTTEPIETGSLLRRYRKVGRPF